MPLMLAPFDRANPKSWLLLLAAASASALAAALIAQFGFGLVPCHLCLLQRIPYAAVIALALAAVYLTANRRWQRLALSSIALLFTVGAGLAAYHAGVEAGIFPGPAGCTAQSAAGADLAQLRAEIMGAPLVTCDQAMLHVLGISLAGWNALLYVFLTLLALYGNCVLRQTSHSKSVT